MNKFVFSLVLIALSSILLGDLIEKGLDYVEDKVTEYIPEGIIKEGTDALVNIGKNKVSDFLHKDKEKDSNWGFLGESDLDEGNLNEEIDRFFQKYNGSEPISTPVEVHFHGSKTLQDQPLIHPIPSSVAVPEFSMEDRPIDFLGGGLHAAKNMDDSLKSAAHGRVYDYLVGLEATSPLIASAVKQIQTWANQLNAMSIQSYDMTALLMPGVGSQMQRGNSYACEQQLIASGKDLIQAKILCQNKKDREKVIQDLAQNNEQILVGSFNVADKILSQMDLSEKELFMNMTGTIVSGSGRIDQFPPLHRQVIHLLSSGQPIENGYRASKYGLEMDRGLVSTEHKSQKERILDLFKSIQQKLCEEDEFTEEEKQLLGSSHLPTATFITLTTQYKGSGATLILERYSDLIAFERTLQFMEEVGQNILFKAETLRAAQISGYELDAYIKQVKGVLEDLKGLKSENLQKIANEQKALDRLIQFEKELRENAREG